MTEWTNEYEKIIIEYKDKIIFFKNIHSKLYDEKYKKHSLLMLSLTILNPFTGIISGIGSIFKLEEHYMLIGASVLNIITGIILSVSKFYKYDEISNDHKNSAIMYTNIENNIRLQLSLSRNRDDDSESFSSYDSDSSDQNKKYEFNKNCKILLVEDIDYNKNLIINMLESIEYKNIYTAENGKDALEMLEKGNYDILILDLILPIVDGYEVLKNMNNIVNNNPLFKQPKIMVTTASVIEE